MCGGTNIISNIFNNYSYIYIYTHTYTHTHNDTHNTHKFLYTDKMDKFQGTYVNYIHCIKSIRMLI